MTILTLLYVLTVSSVLIYIAHWVWVMFLPTGSPKIPESVADANLPYVTVQLPIYNEKYVATRIIDAVCAFDYPAERLQVQVLDDSTDDTTELIKQTISRWREKGINIDHIRRIERDGYKAGALAHGLKEATGEFIAVFDADFVPAPTWLRRTVAHFCQEGAEQLGLVQTKWDHLNPDESRLTYAQKLLLDDFAAQQAARYRKGLPFFFNGTAGLWRRTCVEQAGGWSGQTLSEDLDLSYRAQLAGWRFIYDNNTLAQAEIPTLMSAYKLQQSRWAKGPTQVIRLLCRPLLMSSFSWLQKLDSLLFLTSNIFHVFLVLLLLIKLPLLIWPTPFVSYIDMLLTLVVAGFASLVLLEPSRYQSRTFLVDFFLHFGLSLNNAAGFLTGLFGHLGSEFRRTPKFGSTEEADTPPQRDYALPLDWITIGELLLAVIALLCCGLAIQQAQWFALPFLLLYLFGFSWVGTLSLQEAL